MELTTDEATDALERGIDEADRLLVGAGAGLSAAAGLSYFDRAWFARYQPEMTALGYEYAYQLVGRGDDEWTVGRKWAYLATHINYVRNIFPPAELYKKLLAVLDGHDWFVVTSNCDRQFMRAGFPMNRVFEYQGSYDNFGCSARCSNETWSNRDDIANIVAHIDHGSFECPDDALPRCPRCGALATWASRPGDWEEQGQRYVDFVKSCNGKRLCILELGVGFNTPAVIRWPFEQICMSYPLSMLFRVNGGYRESGGFGGYPQVPPELGKRGIGIGCDAATVIERLHDRLTDIQPTR